MAALHTQTTLELVDDRAVVRKARAPACDLARVATEAEARWLDDARGAGVVSLRRVSVAGCWLETDHAAAATLRTTQPSPEQAASVLAATADVLAGLHARGMAHGNVSPDHVILVGSERLSPVLCSPSSDVGFEDGPRADVRALGSMAESLLATWPRRRYKNRKWVNVMERIKVDQRRINAKVVAALFRELS